MLALMLTATSGSTMRAGDLALPLLRSANLPSNFHLRKEQLWFPTYQLEFNRAIERSSLFLLTLRLGMISGSFSLRRNVAGDC